MKEGQKVICISEDFPWIKKYGGSGEQAKEHPKLGEMLCVDEILGEFLRELDEEEYWREVDSETVTKFLRENVDDFEEYNRKKSEIIKTLLSSNQLKQ